MGILDFLFGKDPEAEATTATDTQLELERARLAQKFGGKPAEADVRCSLLNKQSVEHAKHQNWGLYRNARFEMAEHLRGEKKLKGALELYCEVSFLDANGPTNTNGFASREFPAFQVDLAMQAPGVIGRIAQIGREVGFNDIELKDFYLTSAQRLASAMKLPRTPEQGWKDLSADLGSAQEAVAESEEVGQWFENTKAKTLELIPKEGIKESALHHLLDECFSKEITAYRVRQYTEEFERSGQVRRQKVGRSWVVFKI